MTSHFIYVCQSATGVAAKTYTDEADKASILSAHGCVPHPEAMMRVVAYLAIRFRRLQTLEEDGYRDMDRKTIELALEKFGADAKLHADDAN